MGIFGKKKEYQPVQGLLSMSKAIDYRVYIPSKKEKIVWFIAGMAVSGLVLYIFYESIIASLIVGAALGYAFIPIRTKQIINKRKQRLTQQFRGLLETLSTSIGAGKNMFESFAGAADDLKVRFSDDADIVKEVGIICSGLNNNIQIEELLLNFAARSDIEDIENFANVFATCYLRGGNIKDVIKNTSLIIGDKIEIQMELETMVAGQKNEMNILLVMPILFILVMKSMGGGLIDLSSAVGVLSVTASLVIFLVAYFIGKKITNIKL